MNKTAEVEATKTMIDRVEDKYDMKPDRLVGDTNYGSAAMLGWLVDEKQIEPLNTAARKVMPYATIGALSRTSARESRKPIPLSIAQASMTVQPVPRKIAVAPILCFAKSPAVSMKTHGTWLVEFTRHRNISDHDVDARRSRYSSHTSSAF